MINFSFVAAFHSSAAIHRDPTHESFYEGGEPDK